MTVQLYVTFTSRFSRRYATRIATEAHTQETAREPRLRWALVGLGDGLDGSEPTPRPFPDPELEDPYEVGHMIGCHLRSVALRRLGFKAHEPARGRH